jgi:hypothetical protein
MSITVQSTIQEGHITNFSVEILSKLFWHLTLVDKHIQCTNFWIACLSCNNFRPKIHQALLQTPSVFITGSKEKKEFELQKLQTQFNQYIDTVVDLEIQALTSESYVKSFDEICTTQKNYPKVKKICLLTKDFEIDQDKLFETLSKFPKLTELDIENIPEVKLSSLMRLTNLRRLDALKVNLVSDITTNFEAFESIMCKTIIPVNLFVNLSGLSLDLIDADISEINKTDWDFSLLNHLQGLVLIIPKECLIDVKITGAHINYLNLSFNIKLIGANDTLILPKLTIAAIICDRDADTVFRTYKLLKKCLKLVDLQIILPNSSSIKAISKIKQLKDLTIVLMNTLFMNFNLKALSKLNLETFIFKKSLISQEQSSDLDLIVQNVKYLMLENNKCYDPQTTTFEHYCPNLKSNKLSYLKVDLQSNKWLDNEMVAILSKIHSLHLISNEICYVVESKAVPTHEISHSIPSIFIDEFVAKFHCARVDKVHELLQNKNPNGEICRELYLEENIVDNEGYQINKPRMFKSKLQSKIWESHNKILESIFNGTATDATPDPTLKMDPKLKLKYVYLDNMSD